MAAKHITPQFSDLRMASLVVFMNLQFGRGLFIRDGSSLLLLASTEVVQRLGAGIISSVTHTSAVGAN